MAILQRVAATAAAVFLAVSLAAAHSDEEPGVGAGDHHDMIDEMRETHEGHDHEHDFEAMGQMSPQDMRRVMDAMLDVGLAMRPMNAARGREIFIEKGCIACHSVGGVGGQMGPSLNAEDMPEPMNAFEFAARMWRGAGPMVAMQEQLFGQQIQLTGQELADIIAFVHDETEQLKVSPEDIPEQYQDLIGN